MKRDILCILAGFAGGVAVGVTTMVVVNNIKERKERLAKKPLLTQDLPKKETKVSKKKAADDDFKEVSDDDAEVMVVSAEDWEKFKEITKHENYAMESEEETEEAEEEEESEPDPEEEELDEFTRRKELREKWLRENAEVIEMISLDDFEDESDPDDFEEKAELFYFLPDKVLTDEDGNVLEPIEKWVGNSFDRTKFWTNNWKTLCIRNFPMESRFKVTKPGVDYYDEATDTDKTNWTSKADFFY